MTEQYVAYYRVSSKSQGESGLGLDAQRAIVCHFADCDALAGEFTEVASAKDIEGRPKLRQAVELCRARGYTLIVAKVDRLSRKTEDALDIYGRLDGRLVACDVPNLDKFTLTLFMAIADRERELISIRTKAALAEAKKRGVKLGNPQNLTDESRERSIESKVAAAKSAYRQLYGYINHMHGDGMSYQRIAKRLNEEGHTTRQGAAFQPMTIYRILQRGNGD